MAMFFIDNNVAHKVIEKKTEETEAGTEGDVYVAACGAKMQSWHYGDSPIIFTSGYVGDITKNTNAPLCSKCVK